MVKDRLSTRNAKGSSEHKSEVTVNKTKHTSTMNYVNVPSSVVMQCRKGTE